MTISTTAPRVTYTCNGVSTVFPVPIQAYQATDLAAILTPPISSGLSPTPLTLNSNYTLATSGSLAPPEWTLTTQTGGGVISPFPTGYALQIFLDPLQSQQTQYVQGQQFPSLAVQTNIDRLTQLAQRLQDQLNRAFVAPDSDANPLVTLPTALQRANLAPTFDANGNLQMALLTSTALTQTLFNSFYSLAPQSTFNTFLGGSPPYVQTAAELAAGVTPTNSSINPVPERATRFGADPTGVADSRAAFNTLNSIGQPIVIEAGTYLINSNVTIGPSIRFEPGAILKPAAGVTITLGGGSNLNSTIVAGNYQIFDLSLGGLVTLPLRTSEVWAEWWGASPVLTKTNNEFAFNSAWFALLTLGGGASGYNYGGTIRFSRGDYFISGPTYSSDNIWLRGDAAAESAIFANLPGSWSQALQPYMHQSMTAAYGFAGITPSYGGAVTFTGPLAANATSATLSQNWNGNPAAGAATYPMVFFESAGTGCEQRLVTLTNGSAAVTWSTGLTNACTNYAVALGYRAIFNNRLENLRLEAQNSGIILACIQAPGWQEKCGTDNVYLNNFQQYGLSLDQTYGNASAAYTAYGGPAQIKVRRLEAFLSAQCVPGCSAIYVDQVGTQGWYSVDLDEVSVGSNAGNLAFTASVGGAVSGTLTANWPNPSGNWQCVFSDGESRVVTLTNGATTATWAGALNVGTILSAYGSPPNSNGITGLGANGRIIFNCSDVHFEILQNGFLLENTATVVGNSVQCGGNADVVSPFNCAGSWVGTINLRAAIRGGAVNFVTDSNRSTYPLANAPGSAAAYPGGVGGGNWSQQFVWPPDPSTPFAAGRFVGGTGATSYGFGLSCAHTGGTGVYTFTLSPAANGSATYDVEATSDQFSTAWAVTSASVFVITTKTQAGAATDCTQLSVKVYHSP